MKYQITFLSKKAGKPFSETWEDDQQSQSRFDELVKDSTVDTIRRSIVIESYDEGFLPKTGIREV